MWHLRGTVGSQFTLSLNNLAKEIDGARSRELKHELETALAMRKCPRSNWKCRHIASKGDLWFWHTGKVLATDQGSVLAAV